MSDSDIEKHSAYQRAVTWKEYKGVKYLSIHFGGMDGVDIIRAIKRMIVSMKDQPPKSIRYFLDARNTDISISTHLTLRKLSVSLQPLIYRSAFVGVNGKKVFFFETYKISE